MSMRPFQKSRRETMIRQAAVLLERGSELGLPMCTGRMAVSYPSEAQTLSRRYSASAWLMRLSETSHEMWEMPNRSSLYFSGFLRRSSWIALLLMALGRACGLA